MGGGREKGGKKKPRSPLSDSPQHHTSDSCEKKKEFKNRSNFPSFPSLFPYLIFERLNQQCHMLGTKIDLLEGFIFPNFVPNRVKKNYEEN